MTPRAYVPLSINFFEDDRIMEVSPLARLVFIGGLCIAKRNESDGRITFTQVRRECPDVGDLDALADELVEIGLWTRVDTRTFAIPSWLTWNQPREWLEELRAKRAKSGQIGGLRSGQVRQAKQVASPTPSKLLESVEAKSKLREEKTKEGSRAHALTVLAFEQPIKPALRAGRTGGAFVAVLGIIDKLLEAGHSDSAIDGAIRSGVEVWTTAGLETAIALAKRHSSTLSYDAPEVKYS